MSKISYKNSDLMSLKTESTAKRIVDIIVQNTRTVPDYPKKGVMFHDITTVWKDAEAYSTSQQAIHLLAFDISTKVDVVVGLEARGWVYGAVLADRINRPFIAVRKHGHLPAETISRDIVKEYGEDIVEMHRDAISEGDKVVIVDDLISTGDSILKVIEMVEELGGEVVRVIALSDLKGLGGKQRIADAGYEVLTAVTYPGK